MEERHQKLLELKNIIESNTQDWTTLLASELYFYGANSSSCQCKTGAVRSRLNQFWETNGKQQLAQYES